MYTILIAEDEPPIARYIKRLIESECKGFKVIGIAEGGLEALDKIEVLKPDIVLTDVKMPVMDGIGLVKEIGNNHPEMFSVVISGYQDFNYVKQALKGGAVDYLLKPVDPEQLRSVLGIVSSKLDLLHNNNAIKQLTELVHNLPVDVEKVSSYLGFEYYAGLIVRRGALPGRFENEFSSSEVIDHLNSQLNEKNLRDKLDCLKFWIIEGRDKDEIIIVLGEQHANKVKVKICADLLMSVLDKNQNFYTITYSSKFVDLKSLKDNISNLYRTLNEIVVIGKSQVVADTVLSERSTQYFPKLSSSLENKLAFLISSKSMDGLKTELVRLFETWENDSFPQIWVEKMLRRIFSIVEKHTYTFSAGISLNLEKQLEESLFYSANMGQLLKCVWDMIEEIVSTPGLRCACEKCSSKSLFDQIEIYIRENMSESITLGDICELFGISQSYLSRLFRKYKNKSFVEYITEVRVCEAKRLMVEEKGMQIKDIAAIVGYNDPNYFSRVFKSVTGLPPSKFMN